MTSWQTLLVSVAPVLVTLAITSVAENYRRQEDATEREKDRVNDKSLREQQRQDTIEDSWRSDKMQAHRDLMVFARSLYRCMVNAGKVIDELQRIHTRDGQELTPEIQDHLRRINEAFRPLDEASQRMDALVTAVQMFCSKEARDAAWQFEHKQAMAMLNIHAILAGNGHKQVGGVTFYDRWDNDSCRSLGS